LQDEYLKATAGPDAIAAATGTDVVKREVSFLVDTLASCGEVAEVCLTACELGKQREQMLPFRKF
jgi:hypothetical protein